MYKLQIIGNIGKDAEAKFIKDKKYCEFNVAVQKGKDQTEWIKCYKLDENGKLLPHLAKGTKVYCEGQPSSGGYVKDEKVIGTLSLFVNNLEFLSKAENKPEPQKKIESEFDDLPFE